LLGEKAEIQQQRIGLPADLEVGRGQLQMVALFRIGDRAAGQKGTADKGLAAAILFQQAVVDMKRHRVLGAVAHCLEDQTELGLVVD
jgi:hypothetical protein